MVTQPILETVPINLPGPSGVQWYGTVYRTNSRPTGRRIVVRSAAGLKLFDTDEQYDLANAQSALDEWLTEVVKLTRPAVPDFDALTATPTVKHEVLAVAALRDAG